MQAGVVGHQPASAPVSQARARIVEWLAQTGALLGRDPISQTVGVHERCQTPVEFQLRPQWFVGITEHRAAFRRRAAELVWVPEFMRRRLEDWIDGPK